MPRQPEKVQRLLNAVILCAYAISIALWLYVALDRAQAAIVALAASIPAVVFCYRYFLPRFAIRGIAFLHGIVALAFFKTILDSADSILPVVAYFFLNVTVPSAVVVLVGDPPRPAPKANLPPAYEATLKRIAPLSVTQRALLFLLFNVAGICIKLGGFLFLALIILVSFIAFGSYFLYSLIIRKQSATHPAQRRMKFSYKMKRPAQYKSYWTVDSSQFEDPDKYE